MSVKIDRKLVLQTTSDRFDKYCNRVGGAVSLYHLSAWRQIINRTYGHQTYLLIAIEDGRQHKIVESSNWNEQTEDNTGSGETNSRRVAGILPLIHLKSFAFANELISMPFFDSGGVLADDADVEKALLREAVSLAQRLKVKSIQLRQTLPLLSLPESGPETQDSTANSWLPALDCTVQKRLHKARMLLELPESSEALMGSFKSKLRSQIRKPEKEGLAGKVGGLELLDDFYKVFSINMRDLGSPVHSKRFIKSVLEAFPEESRICLVYKEQQPVACSIILGFNGTVYNPWASSLRKYSKLSPNMLLYWTMLQYACDGGYKYFDFGRSSIEESTYKFKEQWGAKPQLLYWYYISLNSLPFKIDTEKSKFDLAIRIWQKLPVLLTLVLGPPIRKNIGL
ncbi:MAG: GNAT family N-acetyltransferase [Syntrophobacteraceae bacterium]|jgi:FemAB-related protein (PEP-CTERM system-associated)